MSANHQTPMGETVIANIAIEKDIPRIQTDFIRNMRITADEIRHASAIDSLIRKAMNYLQRKWHAPPVQGELLDLYNRRNALSVVDNSLMFKERIGIRPSHRRRFLHKFHSNYPGTNRMKSIAQHGQRHRNVCRSLSRVPIEGERSTSRKSDTLERDEKNMDSSACRPRQAHERSNLPSFGGFALQMA